jgi:hypothetical protein
MNVLRFALTILLMITLATPAARLLAADAPDEIPTRSLDREIAITIRNLKHPRVRELAVAAARALGGNDGAARSEAVQFFSDIRAKHVLSEVIAGGDLDLAKESVDSGITAFTEIDDVMLLLDIALRVVPEAFTGHGEETAIRSAILATLSRRAAEILRVPVQPLRAATDRAHVREWWVRTLSLAKEKAPHAAAVDTMLTKVAHLPQKKRITD